MFRSKYGEFSSLPWLVLLCPLTSVCCVDDAMSQGSIWPLPQGLLALHSFQLGLLALACTVISALTAHSRCKTYKHEARSCRTCSTEQICRRSSCKRLGLLVLDWGCTQCLPSTPLHQTRPLADEWNYEISPECLSAKISSTLWATLGGLFKISVIRVRASKASATKRQFPHRIIIGRPGLAPRGVLKRNYHSEIMKNYHPEIMRSLLMWIPFQLHSALSLDDQYKTPGNRNMGR